MDAEHAAELAVLFRDQVRDVVGVDPSHSRTSLDGQGGWIEGEIGDLHLGVGSERLPASKACNDGGCGECRAKSVIRDAQRGVGGEIRKCEP